MENRARFRKLNAGMVATMRWNFIEIGVGTVLTFGILIWPDPLPLFRIGGFVVGVGLIAWGVIGTARDRKQKPPIPKWRSMWSIDFRAQGIVPFRRLLPLGEAARIAYEKLRGTKVGRIAEGINRDDPIGYYLHALAGMDGVTIYGSRLPSTVLEPIAATELKSGSFVDGGSAFLQIYSDTPAFVNLAIKKVDLRQYIRETKRKVEAITPIG